MHLRWGEIHEVRLVKDREDFLPLDGRQRASGRRPSRWHPRSEMPVVRGSRYGQGRAQAGYAESRAVQRDRLHQDSSLGNGLPSNVATFF